MMNRRLPTQFLRAGQMTAMLGCALVAALPFSAMSDPTNSPAPSKTEFATLGGGCFWCLEAMFKTLPGVKAVTSGYAGGKTENPTYKQVCEGDTGHAEVVRIEFDPAQITYESILDAFWDAHDPTTLNRQGNDVGTQYRSIILYSSDGQRAAAEKSKAATAKHYDAPIVTEIAPLTKFYAAEGYHQDYFSNNPRQPYCVMVVRPKLKHFEEAQKARKTAP
jgi:peptide-methionine (S)-S-oxide reductase